MTKYTLKNGKLLKNAILSLDLEQILDALAKCWKEIHAQFPSEYDDTDLANNLDDIECELDNLMYFEDYDLTYDEVVRNINNLVNDLYYYCKINDIYTETMEESTND